MQKGNSKKGQSEKDNYERENQENTISDGEPLNKDDSKNNKSEKVNI